MPRVRHFLRIAFGPAALLFALVAGCGSNQPPPPNLDRYHPAPELAHAAVDAALTSWKSGRPLDPEGRLPARLEVIDKHRKEGQLLEEFQILGETPGNAKRCFAVRLKLSRPDEEQRVRYAVIGIDPLMVFRHEDLEDLSHWDHPMPAEEGDKPPEKQSAPVAADEQEPGDGHGQLATVEEENRE